MLFFLLYQVSAAVKRCPPGVLLSRWTSVLIVDISFLFYFPAFHSRIFSIINLSFGFPIRTDFEIISSCLFRQFGHKRYRFIFADSFDFFVSAIFLCTAVDFITGSTRYFFPGKANFAFAGIFDKCKTFLNCTLNVCLFCIRCQCLLLKLSVLLLKCENMLIMKIFL